MFLKNSFRYANRVSNSLDSDQARCFVRPDLGSNCLQRLSADDTYRQRVKKLRELCTACITFSKDLHQLVSGQDLY